MSSQNEKKLKNFIQFIVNKILISMNDYET